MVIKIFNYFKNKIKIKMKKGTRKQLVYQVADAICAKTNKLSTKQLKLELRNQYPDETWNKYDNGQGVSELFHELVKEGKFVSVYDNGTYQTYASPKYKISNRKGAGFIADMEEAITNLSQPTGVIVIKSVKKTTKTNKTKATSSADGRISRVKARDLMKNNKGRFFTVTFIKKEDNTERTMNCQYLSNQAPNNSFIKVKDQALHKVNPTNCIRSFDLNTLKKLSIGGKKYNVR